jgi:TolB-like protein/Flp pilus assembly protein TadD
MISEKVLEEIRNKEDLPVKHIGRFHLKNGVSTRNIYAMAIPGLIVPKKSDIKGKLEKPDWTKRIIKNPLTWIFPLLVVLAIMYFSNKETEEIAILPFKNYFAGPEETYLMEGIHDALISEFRKRGVSVRPRTTMVQYAGIQTPIRGIATELNVDWVLESTFRRVNDSIMMEVRLIDGHKDKYITSWEYDTEMQSILSMYSEIVNDISKEIGAKLITDSNSKPEDLEKVNPEAYGAYLRGNTERFKGTKNSFDIALDYFNKSTEIDPEFAPAFAGIATVWVDKLQQGMVKADSALPIMNENVEKALALDSSSYEVQFSYALTSWSNWEFKTSLKAFEKAIKLHQNDPEVLGYYGYALVMMRRFDEAISASDKSVKLEPNHSISRWQHGMILNFSKQYDETIQLLTERLENTPNDLLALSTLKTAYHLKGMEDEAYEIWREDFTKDSASLAVLEAGYQEDGYKMALTRLAESMEERSKTTYNSAWRIATMYTLAGMEDKALLYLEKAYEEHDPHMPSINADPILDFMREDPGFKILIKKMNFPD